MRVVHVEGGRHLFGGAWQVLSLLEGLSDRQRGRHVLVCPQGSALAAAASARGLLVRPVPMRGDADVAFIPRLWGILRAERAELVHLHSRRCAEVLGGIAAALARTPAVLSRRVDNPEPRWRIALKYRLYKHVIAISAAIREVLLREGLEPRKVSCIHSAVDTQAYRPDGDPAWFRATFALADDERAVGMVAQLIPRKGHRVLIDAAAQVLAAHPRTRFLLFGVGPERAAIEARIRASGLAERFVLAGFRDDMPRVLPCLDALVHPAYMEGLGVALLQGAACGVPLIGSRVGGVPEIIVDGETGYTVPPGEPVRLAAAMNAVLAAPERAARLGRNARAFVERRFSIETLVREHAALYERLIANQNPPG